MRLFGVVIFLGFIYLAAILIYAKMHESEGKSVTDSSKVINKEVLKFICEVFEIQLPSEKTQSYDINFLIDNLLKITNPHNKLDLERTSWVWDFPFNVPQISIQFQPQNDDSFTTVKTELGNLFKDYARILERNYLLDISYEKGIEEVGCIHIRFAFTNAEIKAFRNLYEKEKANYVNSILEGEKPLTDESLENEGNDSVYRKEEHNE